MFLDMMYMRLCRQYLMFFGTGHFLYMKTIFRNNMTTLAFLAVVVYLVLVLNLGLPQHQIQPQQSRTTRLFSLIDKRQRVFNLMQLMIKDNNPEKCSQAYNLLCRIEQEIRLTADPKFYN
jgi:hypothetical protein